MAVPVIATIAAAVGLHGQSFWDFIIVYILLDVAYDLWLLK